MHAVAYLFNRYPEATLTTLRREVHAVTRSGLTVCRFAHRPSLQPLASPADRSEAERTEYLAAGGMIPLLPGLIKSCVRHPVKFTAALWIVLRLRPVAWSHVGYLAMACRLVDSLRAARVDLLHTHFAQNSAAVAMLARCLGGPPWTMTVHGPEDLDSTHRPGLEMRVRSASRTIAISRFAANSIRGAALPNAAEVAVIGMGIDDAYLEAPVPVEAASPIVCVARLVARKGHSILIDAIGMLESRGIRPTIELIGDGPLKEDLMASVERLGLSDRIRFCGWQSEQDVRSMIDAAAFLVLPSNAEGLPVSIMEAFARARPVITSNVGAVSELVHDGVNGALVTPGDPRSLADAIGKFTAKAPGELFRMGLLGRAEVVERHDARKNAETLVRIWRDIA